MGSHAYAAVRTNASCARRCCSVSRGVHAGTAAYSSSGAARDADHRSGRTASMRWAASHVASDACVCRLPATVWSASFHAGLLVLRRTRRDPWSKRPTAPPRDRPQGVRRWHRPDVRRDGRARVAWPVVRAADEHRHAGGTANHRCRRPIQFAMHDTCALTRLRRDRSQRERATKQIAGFM